MDAPDEAGPAASGAAGMVRLQKSCRHTGHLGSSFLLSHVTMQSVWNACVQFGRGL